MTTGPQMTTPSETPKERAAPVEREEIDGLVKDAKERIRRSIKLFHNADVEWGIQMIAEFEDGAPEGMTLLDWIDDGIQTLGTALETMARELATANEANRQLLEVNGGLPWQIRRLEDERDALQARLSAIDAAAGMPTMPSIYNSAALGNSTSGTQWYVLLSDYDALKLSHQKLAADYTNANDAMDEAERAGGDAPHRAVDLATRIRMQRKFFTEETTDATERAARMREALAPFAALGGPDDGCAVAFPDLPDDVVIYENSGKAITAGHVRAARKLISDFYQPQCRALTGESNG